MMKSNEKTEKLTFSEKLEENALLLLKSVAALFLVSCLLVIITIVYNRVHQTKEIKLTIEKIKEVEPTNNFPYYKKNKSFDGDLIKYQMDGSILDSLQLLNISLMNKIETIQNAESRINDIEGRNSDLFKLFLAMIGSIFAIVGFFGFKSIHDTRQAAIDTIKSQADETLKVIIPREIQLHVNEYLKGDIGSKVIKEASSEKAKEVAYDKSTEVARSTAQDYMSGINSDAKEFRKAINGDVASVVASAKNDYSSLLSRIQDLEKKLYGLPKDEEDPDPPLDAIDETPKDAPVV